MRHGYPVGAAGMRIGLLGGSFDPPHAGHLHISRLALRRLGLDRIWWLVSPRNPLKRRGPAGLGARVAAARSVAADPRITVTDLETRMGTRLTADTLARLKAGYPGVRFVWLMGADNLASFHHWERWDWIMANVPVGVLARPGQQLAAGLSPAARRFARARLREAEAAALPMRAPPCWTLLTGRMLDLSSTELREAGIWRG